jgi:hypothetical protein
MYQAIWMWCVNCAVVAVNERWGHATRSIPHGDIHPSYFYSSIVPSIADYS